MDNREQKLVDMMFEIAILSAEHMPGHSNEYIANWVKCQLVKCGFSGHTMGSSWWVLYDK